MSQLILLNKSYGILSQFTDSAGRPTLADLIGAPGHYPVGRLDRDSEGLLLLTDDGRWQHHIAHPANKMSKTYWVQVEGEPDEVQLKRLRQGILLVDGLALPAKVQRINTPVCLWPRTPPVRHRKKIPTAWLALTLVEGRNRQVRRMTATIGHPTLRLIRYRIGSWTLDGLLPGQWRSIELPGSPLQHPGRLALAKSRKPEFKGRGKR